MAGSMVCYSSSCIFFTSTTTEHDGICDMNQNIDDIHWTAGCVDGHTKNYYSTMNIISSSPPLAKLSQLSQCHINIIVM